MTSAPTTHVLVIAGLSTVGKRANGGASIFRLRKLRHFKVPLDINMPKIRQIFETGATDHGLKCTRFMDSALESHYKYNEITDQAMRDDTDKLKRIIVDGEVMAEIPTGGKYGTFYQWPINMVLSATLMASKVLRPKVATSWNERNMGIGSMGDMLYYQADLVRDFIERGCMTVNERQEKIDERLGGKGMSLAECDSADKRRWRQRLEDQTYSDEHDMESDGVQIVWAICANNDDAIAEAETSVTIKVIELEIRRLKELMAGWIKHENDPVGAKEAITEWRRRLVRAVRGEDLQEDKITADFENPVRRESINGYAVTVQSGEDGVPTAESLMRAWKADPAAQEHKWAAQVAADNPALTGSGTAVE